MTVISAIPTTQTNAGELPFYVFPKGKELPVAEDPRVGDTVAIYSRGYFRAAKVTKVGPKRLTAIYTTQGAIDEAVKIAQINFTAREFGAARHAREMAAEYREKADRIDAGEIQPEQRGSGCMMGFLNGEEDRAQRIAEWRAEYPTKLRQWADESAARGDESSEDFAKHLAAAQAKDAKPRAERIAEATHITSKSVPLTGAHAVQA